MANDVSHQRKCLILVVVILILEICSTYFICRAVESICVQGGEIHIYVMIAALLGTPVLVPDFVFAIGMIFMKTLGTDPVAVVYNFFVGLLTIIAGISLILVLMVYCGNKDQIYVIVAGVLFLLAGILHIVDSIYCHTKLSLDEREFPKSMRKLGKKPAAKAAN